MTPPNPANPAETKASSAPASRSAAKISPRLRVVISCVTFDTVKVTQPIAELRGEKVYLFHWDGGKSSTDKDYNPSIYGEFYREVVRRLRDYGLEDEDIVEVSYVKVFEFKPVLSELLRIMAEERAKGNDIYVNVSAGSVEYTVAATLASMMVEGVKPITVNAKEYTIKKEKVRETFSCEGTLYGQVKQIRDLDILPTFSITPPPRDLVLALRVLRDRKARKVSTSYPAMVQAIKEAGAWTHALEGGAKEAKGSREKATQPEIMFYSRHYIDAWIRRGWVSGKNGRNHALELTDSGNNVVDIFHLD